jgi:hypothetical protein
VAVLDRTMDSGPGHAYPRFAMRAAALLGFALCACVADTLEIALEIEADGCAASSFEQVSVISIEVYGNHDGKLCALARRCLFAVDVPEPLHGPDDLAATLRGANQPLVEGELDGAEYIHVVGRTQSCWDLPDPEGGVVPDHPLCGANDFHEVEGGAVPIVLQCEACPAEEIELCP